MGVAGCLCPIYSNIILIYTASRAIMYSAASSAFVADIMTCLKMWAMLRMARRHEEMSARLAFGFLLRQIAGVAMDPHDHVTAVVGEDRVFLRGNIVRQLVGMCQSFFGWVSRL